jgi:hypothetical protein
MGRAWAARRLVGLFKTFTHTSCQALCVERDWPDGLAGRRAGPHRGGMNRLIGRVQLIFVAIFAVAAFGIWAYQSVYVSPAQSCERSGNWWDKQTRTCGHVVYLPDITHRKPGQKAPTLPTLPQSAGAAAQATSQQN